MKRSKLNRKVNRRVIELFFLKALFKHYKDVENISRIHEFIPNFDSVHLGQDYEEIILKHWLKATEEFIKDTQYIYQSNNIENIEDELSSSHPSFP